jgi:hypothetical protein
MGDRCYLEVYVATVHVERFSQIVFGESAIEAGFEHDSGAMFVADEQANYGLCDELQKAAKAGCIFEGSHGPGTSYGPARFAAYGGEIVYLETDHNGEPMVLINWAWLDDRKDEPLIQERDLQHATRWKETIGKVNAVSEYLMEMEAQKREARRKVGWK